MSATAARRRLCAVVPLVLAALAATAVVTAPGANASAGQGPARVAGRATHHATHLPPVSFRENHAANIAIAHIGDPYRYGAAGPGAFDCSGLAMYSYGHSRLSLPRTSSGQYAAVRHILKTNLMRGDLVFFHDSSGHVYHVAIFLYWNSRHQAVIVHAPYPGQVVHRAPVWTSAWYAGTRRP